MKPTPLSAGLRALGSAKSRVWLPGLVFFVLAFLFLYWVAGDVLRIAGDEGIYLQGGRLVAAGRQPYRDFFTLTGPLTFWIEGLLALWSGTSLAIMRVPPILDAAFLAFAVYYLTSRHTGALYAMGTAVAFLAYQTRLRQLNVNHRWDSAALSMAAILLALSAVDTKRRWMWSAVGLLTVAAACATPSMVLLAFPFLVWCGWCDRRGVWWLAGGAAVGAGIAAAYLQSVHALLPMMQSMRWTGANYTDPNRVFYGGLPLAPLDGWWKVLGFGFSLLPAILPPAAILGWLFYSRGRPDGKPAGQIVPLLGLAAAMVFAAWPRWTSDTLLHTLALPWFLCALLFYRLTSAGQRRWICIAVLFVSLYSLAGKAWNAGEYAPRETRAGNLRAAMDESEFLAGLERWVRPGDSLFSYPYFASLYFYLDAQNPTYYPFLQPGMMTPEDERRTAAELEAAPPRWVIYEDYPPELVQAIWPGSDPARIAMAAVSSYLRGHYHPVDTVTGPWSRVVVMERNATSSIP